MVSINDIAKGTAYGLWYSQHHIIHSFVIIPIGILILFTILYGFNILLADIAKINFPASVLGMLVNLIILCVLNIVANIGGPTKEGRFCGIAKVASWILEHYLMIIQPSMNFTLKWINVFFLPSFITLPLSEEITFVECVKIAAVFVLGGLLLMVFDVYLIMTLKKLLALIGYDPSNIEKLETASGTPTEEEIKADENIELFDLSKPYTRAQKDITTIDISSLRPVNTEPNRKIRSLSISENPFDEGETDTTITRFATTQIPREPSPSLQLDSRSSNLLKNSNDLGGPSQFEIPHQRAYEEYSHLSGDSKRVAIIITNYIDWLLYGALFLLSLPFYYITSIHVMLPFHLGLTVTCYFIALLIPQKFPQAKKFAHPILILTAGILFVCFISSLIYHKGSPKGFLDDLRYYKTGKTYLYLFNGKAMYDNGKTVPLNSENFTAQPMWPGCGDFLSSLMDISIVSLSLPMFTHRKDFVRNFWVLMPPLLISMVITFLCYPIICTKIGISPERSIGFIGRLVTLALGTPLMKSLEGSVSLMAVCTILSGICGVLIGDLFFKLLRIPTNDYVTRGVTLGINCGAIATAHLLNVDPRAASMSSLSFSVFGTIMIILASIGAVRDFIQNLAGL